MSNTGSSSGEAWTTSRSKVDLNELGPQRWAVPESAKAMGGFAVVQQLERNEPDVTAAKGGVDRPILVVLAGTRSLPGWETFFVGSTSRRLIRKCPAPFWVVKHDRVGKPQAVLASTDFSDVRRRALLAGLEVAERVLASIRVLHVMNSMDVPEKVVPAISAGSSLRDEINEAVEKRFGEFVSSLGSTNNEMAQLPSR